MTDTELDEIEQRLRGAIAEDIGQMYTGDYGNVVVLDYIVIASVLDEDGEPDVRYTMSQRASYTSVLGWLDWMQTLTRNRLIKAHTKGQ